MLGLRKGMLIAIAALLAFGAVFSASLPGCKNEVGRLNPTDNTSVPETTTIPTKDTAVFIRVETATFALG